MFNVTASSMSNLYSIEAQLSNKTKSPVFFASQTSKVYVYKVEDNRGVNSTGEAKTKTMTITNGIESRR